jgi:hypothetical protein
MKQSCHSLTQIYVQISFDTLNIYNKMNHCNKPLPLFSCEPKKTGKLHTYYVYSLLLIGYENVYSKGDIYIYISYMKKDIILYNNI